MTAQLCALPLRSPYSATLVASVGPIAPQPLQGPGHLNTVAPLEGNPLQDVATASVQDQASVHVSSDDTTNLSRDYADIIDPEHIQQAYHYGEMRACTTANGDLHIVIANVLAPGLVTAVARKALLDGRPEATQASDFNPAVLRALSQRDPRQRDEEIAGVELEYHASVIEWMRRTQHPTVPTVWLLQEVEPALARAVQDAGYLPVTAPWRHQGAPAMFAQCHRDWHGAHEFRWQDCGGVRAASAVHGWVHARLQVTATTQISFAIGHHSTWPPNLFAHDDLVFAAGDSVSGSIAWEQHNHECITSPGGAGIYQTYVRGLRQVDGPTLTRVSFSDHLQAVEMTVEPISSSAARSEVCLPSPICQHQ